MSERAKGRFGFGRRPRDPAPAPVPAADGAAPCIPCGQKAGLRAFSLNPDAPPIAEDFVPRLTAGIDFAILDGEVVLFDVARSISTLLNSSAALVWASVDDTATVAEIVDDLATETGAERTTIASDVRDTLARFAAGGIIAAPPGADSDDPDRSGDAAAPAPAAPEADGVTDPAAREPRRARMVDRALDRIEWLPTAGPRRFAGADAEVRTDSPELLALLTPALERLAPATAAAFTVSITDRGRPSPRRFRILRGTETRAWASTVESAMDSLFTDLNDLAINNTPDRLVFHAGAVERGGSIVVVAAPSGRGKSTLTAALVKQGFGYLTDEVVAIDPVDRSVLPYPKPFDLDRVSAELLGLDLEGTRSDGLKVKVAPEALGSVAAGGGSVQLLVLLRDPTAAADGAVPPPPTTAETLVEILGNTFASSFAPAGVDDPLGALADLTSQVPILWLDRGSLDDACRAVDEHLHAIAPA